MGRLIAHTDGATYIFGMLPAFSEFVARSRSRAGARLLVWGGSLALLIQPFAATNRWPALLLGPLFICLSVLFLTRLESGLVATLHIVLVGLAAWMDRFPASAGADILVVYSVNLLVVVAIASVKSTHLRRPTPSLQDDIDGPDVLAVCAWCSRIEDTETNRWISLEEFAKEQSESTISHAICPDCCKRWG